MNIGEPELVYCPMCRDYFEAMSEDVGSYMHRCRKVSGGDSTGEKLDIKKLEDALRGIIPIGGDK